MFGIASSFVFPAVQLVRWQIPSDKVAGFQTFEFDQVLTLLLGLACGAFCGWIFARFVWRQSNANSRANDRDQIGSIVYSFSMCGLFLGWQAAISVSLIVILLDLVGPLLGRLLGYGQLNCPARILVAVIVHLVFWKLQSLLNGYWPSHASSALQIMLCLLVIIIGTATLHKKGPINASIDLQKTSD